MSAKAKKPLVPRLRFTEFLNEEAWSKGKLCEIGNFIGGGTPSTSNPKYWDGNIQWYTPKEIKDRMLKPSMRTISEDGLKNSSAKLLPKGTILITTRATIGDVAIANKECATNQGFQSLVVNEAEVNLFWYYWILLHKNELIKRSSGSTFKEIQKTKIEVIPTFSPNKKEQQKIAACLTALDDLISAATEQLDALKQHKQGLMQQLFPAQGETVPRLRFAEFRDAGEWERKKLENVGEPLMCKRIFKSQTITNSENAVPFYKIGTFGRVADSYISCELYNEYKGKYSFPNKGEILISASGTIGRLVVYNGEAAYFQDSNIVWLGHNEELVKNNFLFYCYSILNWQTSDGGIIKRLYNSDLNNIKVCFPKAKKEQQKIAACLTALDDLISAQRQKIAKLKTHKHGLMQQLFPAVDETH